ncbi:MAG: DUF2093 domain-containing protein [Sphingobium sp.]
MADLSGLAILRYDTPHFDVVRPGQFVLCAVTGVRIDLDDLKYWSSARQEAYAGPNEASAAMLGSTAVASSPAE